MARSWFILLLCFPAVTLVADGMVRGGSDPNRVGAITAAKPDQGTWEVGTGLRDRLEVTVTAADGQPVEGVAVRWVVETGSGTVSDDSAVTNRDGRAGTLWILGHNAGPQVVTATVIEPGVENASVSFRAVATPASVEGLERVGHASGDPTRVSVRARDAFGNGVAGIPIVFEARGGSPVADTTVTDSRGVATVTWPDAIDAGDTLLAMAIGTALAPLPVSKTLSANDANAEVPVPAWVRRMTGVPPAREAHTFVYDAAHQVGVLVGGRGHGLHSDIWLWDRSGWIDTGPGPRPGPRVDHAAAHDGAGVIVFGGSNGQETLNDTWVWNGGDWVERTLSERPAARYGHQMAYDEARKLVVMFGGATGSGQVLDDTWTWDRQRWTPSHANRKPPPRVDHAMAYDRSRDRVVLFGGSGLGRGEGLLNDTWEWDGGRWRSVPAVDPPPPMAGAAMAYDPSRRHVVLYGGLETNAYASDTWTWDGVAWIRLDVGEAPTGRETAEMIYDPNRGRLILFGGSDGGPLSETWELRTP